MKYRALISFAGPNLSMYAGEEREITDENIADRFERVGYIVKIENLTDDSEDELKSSIDDSESVQEVTDSNEDIVEKKKDSTLETDKSKNKKKGAKK